MQECAISNRCRPESCLRVRKEGRGEGRAAYRRRVVSRIAIAALLSTSSAITQAADPLSDLPSRLSAGKANLDARLRYEHVGIDGPLTAPLTEEEADALTIRARLGYTTGSWNALDGQLEFEGTRVMGGEHFNSSENGETTYPFVADPEVDEVNQAWLRWSGLPGTQIKYGRQRILLDNQRFVGNAGWRQNEVTYDATLLTTTIIPRTTFTYAYLTNVNAFKFFNYAPAGLPVELDDNVDVEAHLVNISVAVDKKLLLTGYGYFLDFDEIPTGAPVRLFADTRTIGLRAVGALPIGPLTANYAIEVADQQDHEDSAGEVDASYTMLEAGLSYAKLKSTLGYERLEGDGSYSFQTPLATTHAFQGWADSFSITPAGGLRRIYLSLGATVAKIGMTVVVHSFRSDQGGIDYGSEIDALLSYPVIEQLVVSAKVAHYIADEFPVAGTPAQAVDTDKAWLLAEYKF